MRLRVTKLSVTGWNDFFSGDPDPSPPGLAYLFLDDNRQVYLDNGNPISILLNNFIFVLLDNGDQVFLDNGRALSLSSQT